MAFLASQSRDKLRRQHLSHERVSIDYATESKGDNRAAVASFFVSLYLVLLAFFVLLNTIAQIAEEKVDKAADSVNKAFSAMKHTTEVRADSEKLQLSVSNPTGSLRLVSPQLEAIGKVVQDAVTLVDAKVVETGNTMEVQIPLGSFFYPKSEKIRAEHQGFLLSMVEEIGRQSDSTHLDIECIIGADWLKDYPTAENNLALARAGEFARVMTQLGSFSTTLYIGVEPGRLDNIMVLHFYLRDTEDKKIQPVITSQPEPSLEEGASPVEESHATE